VDPAKRDGDVCEIASSPATFYGGFLAMTREKLFILPQNTADRYDDNFFHFVIIQLDWIIQKQDWSLLDCPIQSGNDTVLLRFSLFGLFGLFSLFSLFDLSITQ
jgi:hypothetical protein